MIKYRSYKHFDMPKYRSYKRFDMPKYRNILKEHLENFDKEIMSYEDFHEIFIRVLDRHAPMKTKIVRGNNGPFMTKTLSKEIMHRSKLKNNYNKIPTEENKKLYKKQRNFCVALLKREKRNYYNNLELSIFKDNKTFWQTVKPLFSDKQKLIERNIVITDDGKVYTDNTIVAEKLNTFFIEAVQCLEIEPYLSETAKKGLQRQYRRNYQTIRTTSQYLKNKRKRYYRG